jgi:hypothetical protein
VFFPLASTCLMKERRKKKNEKKKELHAQQEVK